VYREGKELCVGGRRRDGGWSEGVYMMGVEKSDGVMVLGYDGVIDSV